jgi:hypothetical protein
MTSYANWYAGWLMILAAFISGAAAGLFFHRDDFLGGYASWRRRLMRLGHIALAALGLFNVVYAMTPAGVLTVSRSHWAGLGLIVGGIAMPTVCYLSAWKREFRRLFFIPVGALIGSVVVILTA